MNPLIIALDVATREKALSLVKELKDYVSLFKVGPVLWTRYGPDIVREIKDHGSDVFLDLKLYDIPNTAAQTVRAIIELGVFMFTVHISGGKDMLESAVNVLVESQGEKPKIIGVTVLTSISTLSVKEVSHMAVLARSTGLDGVVASGQEIEEIRKSTGKDFLIVVPGVRPEGFLAYDQKRTATPGEAIKKGADYIVVGRPIIESEKPMEVVRQILYETSNLKPQTSKQFPNSKSQIPKCS